MCGIFFCVFKEGKCCQNLKALKDSVIPLVARRGPDCLKAEESVFINPKSGDHFIVNFTGSVLHLRGDLTPQPLVDSEGNALLWNGEVFGGIQVPDNCNDTTTLFSLLGECSDINSILSLFSSIQGPWAFVYYQAVQEKIWFGRDFFGRRSMVWHLPNDEEDIFSVASVAQRHGLENYQRDWLWKEIPANGIYCLEFSPKEDNLNHMEEPLEFPSFKLKKYTWASIETRTKCPYSLRQPVLSFNKQLPLEQDLKLLDEHYSDIGLTMKNGFEHTVKSLCITNGCLPRTPDSLKKIHSDDREIVNVASTTRINTKKTTEEYGSLFYNALCNDSDVQSASIVKYDEEKEIGPGGVSVSAGISEQKTADESRQLSVARCKNFNKSFLPSRINDGNLMSASDSQYGIQNADEEVEDTCKSSNERGVLVYNVQSLRTLSSKTIGTSPCTLSSLNDKLSTYHLTNTEYLENLPNELIDILGEAVRKRVFNLPRQEKGGLNKKASCTTDQGGKHSTECCKHARVGILFSGGIDSIVLAALADRYVPVNESIDLMNVAFEHKQPKPNPTSKKKTKPSDGSEKKPSFDVPDRLTGISGLKELARINPQRQWNFVEVNVTLQDLQKERCEHITHLVSPLTSVLDDSIGCALWFAARGSGMLKCPSCISGINTPCGHPHFYTSDAKVLLVGMGADEQLGGYARHRTKFNQDGWLGLVNEMEMEVNRISQRNLGRDDRCISDHGREARFPFLDEQVVSFLSGIPVWFKADPRLPRGTGEKILLRKSARLLGLTSSAVLPKRAIQFGSRIAKLEGSNEKGSDTCARLKS